MIMTAILFKCNCIIKLHYFTFIVMFLHLFECQKNKKTMAKDVAPTKSGHMQNKFSSHSNHNKNIFPSSYKSDGLWHLPFPQTSGNESGKLTTCVTIAATSKK